MKFKFAGWRGHTPWSNVLKDRRRNEILRERQWVALDRREGVGIGAHR